MASGVYKFFAAAQSVERFVARNRPSTDALSALETWRAGAAERRYEKLEDTDNHIVARLSWGDDDGYVGEKLQELLLLRGLQYEYLGT